MTHEPHHVYHDSAYLLNMQQILLNGLKKTDRTGTGTRSVFGVDMRFDLSDWTIPLLTSKRMHWPSIIHELLWYIKGDTNIKYLEDNGVRIWREWANEQGELGPLYGKMLRDWGGVDQLQTIIDTLRTNPDDRRMVVSYWDPTKLPHQGIPPKDNPALGLQALAPCHYTWQVYSAQGDEQFRRLSLKLTQRSADYFLGVPFNIAQYSILLLMLCHITNHEPGELIWSGGDVHVYSNHVDQCNTQLSCVGELFPSPQLSFNRKIKSIDDFKFEDFILHGYQSHPPIKAQVAI